MAPADALGLADGHAHGDAAAGKSVGQGRPPPSQPHPGQQDLLPGRTSQALHQLHRRRNRRRARRRSQGIRHRRAGLRQGTVLRSAHRSHRPRPGAAAAHAARPLLPRRRQQRRADRRPAQGRLRAGVPHARRRAGAEALADRDAGRPQHRGGDAARRRQPGRQPRLLLPRPARRDRARADLDQGAARAGGAPATTADDQAARPRGCGAGDHRRRSFGARSRCASRSTWSTARAASTCGRSPPTSISRSGRRPGSDRQAHRRQAGAGSRQRSARPARAGNPTTSPRAISTCRAATISISAPKKACTRRSSSSRRRSSKTRSSRWRTAAWPTPTACSPITACSVPPMCGPRRHRARRRR